MRMAHDAAPPCRAPFFFAARRFQRRGCSESMRPFAASVRNSRVNKVFQRTCGFHNHNETERGIAVPSYLQFSLRSLFDCNKNGCFNGTGAQKSGLVQYTALRRVISKLCRAVQRRNYSRLHTPAQGSTSSQGQRSPCFRHWRENLCLVWCLVSATSAINNLC